MHFTMSSKTLPYRVAVAQPNARMHYAVPKLLDELGYLSYMFTGAYAGHGSWLNKLLSLWPDNFQTAGLRRLSQREIPLSNEKVVAFNTLELSQSIKERFSKALVFGNKDTFEYFRHFNQHVAKTKQFASANIIYSYGPSASLELVEAAKRQGIKCIVEQPIAPHEELDKIRTEEQISWPGWENPNKNQVDLTQSIERQHRVWELADLLVAPSSYVHSSMVKHGAQEEKIRTFPYAVSLQDYQPYQIRKYNKNRPLRVLFVGSLSLRKGIPYLLKALSRFPANAIEATFVGSNYLNTSYLEPYSNVANFVGRTSRKEVIRYYNWADVFMFPSLCEGSATVTYEARASGLPVIATPNTGAWIDDGSDGIIIPIRNIDALEKSLISFIENPILVEEMSVAAGRSAVNYSWSAYKEQLEKLVLTFGKEM